MIGRRHEIRGALSLAILASACGGEQIQSPPIEQAPAIPKVHALSTYDASVGTLIEVYGADFPDPSRGSVELVFQGNFDSIDGSSSPVDLSVEARYVDPGTVRWVDFGPFANPLAPRGVPVGTFIGSIAARMRTNDGQRTETSAPVDIEFHVKPSVIVKEFQPTTASCNGQVKRALGGAAYRVQVEAAGFQPVTFTYSLSGPVLAEEPIAVRQIASGPFDTIGERGDFVLPEVPPGYPSYGAVLSIEARDADGRTYSNLFAFEVHRPLEVFYNGNVTVAEVLAPTPVSGCIPGGDIGRDVSYSESQTEARSKSYNLSWNESWLSSHTVSQGSQQTVGLSEQNGVGFSTTDGQSFNWSMGTEINGKVSLFELVEMGVGFTAESGGTNSRSVEQSANRVSGIDASTTTTDSESVSDSVGGGQGESFAWDASSSESIAKGFGGFVVPKTYGVFYRQTLRMLRRAALVTYNQCGAATVVAEVDFTDWAWSPDLATGDSCPPLPVSNLPSAECYIPPCAGE